MQTFLKNKLKQKMKQQAVSKGVKLLTTLIISLAPGGILGKVFKIIGSRWVLNVITNKIAK